MAASSSSVGSGGSSWSKWQIALAFGAPVAVGIGIWYLRNSGFVTGQAKGITVEDDSKNKIASMATSSQTSLDVAGEETNVPFEPAEEVWLEVAHNSVEFKLFIVLELNFITSCNLM
jgi:hypothetical protein